MLRGLHLNDKTQPKTQMANESASLRAGGNNPVQGERWGRSWGSGLPAFTARGFLTAAGREAGLAGRQVGGGGGRGSVSAGSCFLADALRSARMIGKREWRYV